MSNDIAKLLYNILKVYHIPITRRSIEKAIKPHPEYPSFQSISDAMDSWKIKHVVMRLSLEKLHELDVPVIAQMKKGEFIWITQISDSEVHYRNLSNKKIIEKRNRFEKEWSGIALAIEDVTDAGEPDYRKKRWMEIKETGFKYGITCSCIVLFALLTCLSGLHAGALSLLPKILLLLVNGAGCYISYILIRQEKNQSGSLVRKFCKTGTHIDCNKVTKSNYSKLFGLLSWSEIGMAWFSAVTLWVGMAAVNAEWLSPLWWLLLIPLPFTLWSLFTQAFLIRKWCLFCCATVLLLWLNAAVACFFLPFPCMLPVVESALLALLVLVCTAAVVYINRTDNPGHQYAEQRETARIKYDYKTLQSQLSESRFETDNVGFVRGNSQALHEIILYVCFTGT